MNNLVRTILSSADSSSGGSRQLYRVHRKNGHPFALFPSNARLQFQLAFLLPAQSGKARLYRQIVRFAGLAGVGFPLETDEVGFPGGSALVSLIRKISKGTHAPLLLPGNPRGIAPRLVFICLDEHNSPVGVIKAGQTPAARELIRREHGVLQQLHSLSVEMSAPQPFDLVETDSVSAFGMEFIPGKTPRWPTKHSRLADFLTPWIDETRSMKIADLPAWKALGSALRSVDVPLSSDLVIFAQTSVRPTWFHGDFAPWNLRVQADGTWTIIDWERGERDGIPGWDWFHFFTQASLLIQRSSPHATANRLLKLVRSNRFQSYAERSGIHGIETPLLYSYLLHSIHVLAPSEGTSQLQEVLQIMKNHDRSTE